MSGADARYIYVWAFAVAAVFGTAIGGTIAHADIGDQLYQLFPHDGATFDQFGVSVAISGSTAIVGALWHDIFGDNSGAAYLFDASDTSSPGDVNCDAEINAFDIEPFLLALFDPLGYAVAFPDCDNNNADINGDGTVDAFDIEPSLDLLFP